MAAPFPDEPSRFVESRDGTRIAVFSAGAGPALVLVHGTSSDHLTWRGVGPTLAERHTLHAVDRRGRGASDDAPAWSIERELQDVAAVAEAVAGESGAPVGVVGHSLGGRLALGAALLTGAIGRVVSYEGAPAPPGSAHGDLPDRLRADLEAGDREALLSRFMTVVVGMSPDELARFRADPVWPLRVAAAPTIARELEAAEGDPAIGLDRLAGVRVPVLQLVGSVSRARFRDGAAALGARLPDGRLVVIEGARHAAHQSHPAAFVASVEAFLAG